MHTVRNFVFVASLFLSAAVFAQIPAAPGGPPVKPHEAPLPNQTKAPQCADHHVFHSASLDREMAYCVLLPAGYETGKEAYPVLYLLHGLWGDENDWLGRTKLAEHARNLKLIIVMPEGDDAWYTNSATDPRNRYEDYIATDLVREVESKYRTQPARATRFIAGLSMGGYGALKMGIKHPEQYSFVGAFSGALSATESTGPFQTPAIAFGPAGNPARRENNIYRLVATADPKVLPYIFITCGVSDGLRGDDLEMADLMRSLGIRYEYSEFPGAHTWQVWDRSAAMVLMYLRTTKAIETIAP